MIDNEGIEQIVSALNNVANALSDVANATIVNNQKQDDTKTEKESGSKKKKEEEGISSAIGTKIAAAISTGMSMYTSKLTTDAKEIYNQLHGHAFDKTKAFASEGIESGIRYDDEFLKKMYNRHAKIGDLKTRLDERMTKDLGMSGGLGSDIKRGMRELLTLFKGADTSKLSTSTA